MLAQYADGETEQALAAMLALEGEMDRGDDSVQEALRRVEMSVARRLAAQSLEALEALALFHEALYRRALAQGDPAATSQARTTLVALAVEYAEMRTADADTSEMARLVSRLGMERLAARSETMAIDLLELTLSLDPEDVASRLCLAWIHEKRGRYATALELLRALRELDEDHREGRLRLAMQWARQGRDLEASSLLDGLASSAPNDWIRALAVQERARSLAASGELESAVRLISETRRDMPCDNGLAVQQAYLSERAGGSRDRPAELDETLRRCTATSGTSPRNIYNRLPGSCEPDQAKAADVFSSRLHLQSALAAIR